MSSKLPIEEQMEYETIPDWHKEILAERMERYRSGLDEGITWEEFETGFSGFTRFDSSC